MMKEGVAKAFATYFPIFTMKVNSGTWQTSWDSVGSLKIDLILN